MAAFPLETGEVFADRYRIIRCVASGGMGAVYEAVHTVTERRCALKVMLGHTVQREKLRERFMQESKLAAQIGSEYIVDILDAGVDEKTQSPFLVMELLEGEDLAQRLVRLGRFSATETVTYLWQAALALDRTHQNSIVHRDLKASNLFLTHRENGTPLVKVLDFGVAKVMPMESGSEGHTQTVGTPIYMAPEQFRAGGRVSPATDIYALGMLAYTMLVGSHYWAREHQDCENPFAFASVAVKGPQEPPSVRADREGVILSAEFDEWFARATSRVPGERFASATEAVEELATVLAVAVPAASNAANTAPTPHSGISKSVSMPGLSLPETVDSRSAELSADGLASGSGGSMPALGAPHTGPSGDEPVVTPAPERTEVSLSVTSGGLDEEHHARQRSRSRARFALVGLAATALVGGAFVLRTGNEASTELSSPATKDPSPKALGTVENDKEKSSPPAAETAEAPSKPQDTASEPTGEADNQTVPITSLDELPRASDDAPAQPAHRRKTAKRAPVAKAEPTQEPAPEPTQPPVAPKPAPKSREIARELPGPKAPLPVDDRTKLYGRY